MEKTFEQAFNEYENKKGFNYLITDAQLNIIKQLVRFEMAELINDNAHNKVIDFLTELDASLNNQFKTYHQDSDDLDELPF